MFSIAKGKLKAHMLEYFRKVEETGEEMVVTDHHRPVLKVVPYKEHKSFKDTFASYQGKAIYFTPVTEPETEEWGDNA